MLHRIHAFAVVLAALCCAVLAQTTPPQPARDASKSDGGARIKILEVRRWSAPWAVVFRTAEGEYATLDAQGRKRELPAAPVADPSVSASTLLATDFSALEVHPPQKAAILLVSLPETVAKRSVFFEALRKLETELGYRFNQVTFELPPTSARNPWGKPDGTRRSDSGTEFVLSLISSLDELGAGLDSTETSQRRDALAAFRHVRTTVAGPYLLRGATDPDAEVRRAALQELEARGAESIPVLRTALRNDAESPIRDLLVRMEYGAAISANGPKAYADFLNRYRDSRYEAEMRYRLLGSKGDAEGMRKLKATFAGKGQVHDIVDALREGWIELVASGGGIRTVHVRVRRRVQHPIALRVPAASYFVAGSAAAQNMVTTASASMELIGDDWQTFELEAACANMPKDVPNGGVKFAVERIPPQSELPRVIESLAKANAGFVVRQAAVWIVTDNATAADLAQKLFNRSVRTGATTRAIADSDIALAMQIAASAGVDLSTKAIWADRQAIHAGTTDPKLKKWLGGRL